MTGKRKENEPLDVGGGNRRIVGNRRVAWAQQQDPARDGGEGRETTGEYRETLNECTGVHETLRIGPDLGVGQGGHVTAAGERCCR